MTRSKPSAAAREARAGSQARFEAATRRLAEITRSIADNLETTPAGLAELAGLKADAPLPDLTQVETRLGNLKGERERLGAVNLRAEEELAEIDAKRTTLIGERDDLVEAIKRLRQAIGSLNREGRERLPAAFDVVNEHFRRLFTTLFGGGTAELTLVDSDDPLEAGLEILARPPGKKPMTMTLLSGGEQALTATALIFAVFLTNPSPICVLDEVDAPLDDAQCRAILRPPRRHGAPDRDALRRHHPQPDHHGAHEPPLRRHHGRARRVAARSVDLEQAEASSRRCSGPGYRGPAFTAQSHAAAASGRTSAAIAAAFSFEAVPSRTRPTMPCRIAARRKKL